MARFETIDKKVGIPYSLKYYFGRGSDEFGRITIKQKIDLLRSVVNHGYSVYDLSEKFRKDRSKYYDHDDMHSVLCYYISIVIFNQYINPYVNKYYENETDETVAKALDKYLMNPVSEEDFITMVIEHFDIKE